MKKLGIVFVCLLVTACGFRPLYQGTNTFTGESSALQQIWIDSIHNEMGTDLRNNLIDRFYHGGYPEKPAYHLRITLRESSRDIAIERNDVTTRSQMVIVATYQLRESDTSTTIESGSARAVSSYNILPSQYTTLVTRNEARQQVLQELADKITMRMAVVLENK